MASPFHLFLLDKQKRSCEEELLKQEKNKNIDE
jgi:hypothetical protein